MKTFKDLIKNLVVEKNVMVGKSKIVVTKSGNRFKASIDGEHLDDYESEKEAITMAKEFIKQFSKGK